VDIDNVTIQNLRQVYSNKCRNNTILRDCTKYIKYKFCNNLYNYVLYIMNKVHKIG